MSAGTGTLEERVDNLGRQYEELMAESLRRQDFVEKAVADLKAVADDIERTLRALGAAKAADEESQA